MPSLAQRFNNPFNISLPSSGYFGGSIVGAPGQTGYAAFPDMATGYAAGANRVSQYVSGQTSFGTLNTIGSLGPIYAQGPGRGNWEQSVSNISGIGINQTIDPNNAAQMSALNHGILVQESPIGESSFQQFGGNNQIASGPIDGTTALGTQDGMIPSQNNAGTDLLSQEPFGQNAPTDQFGNPTVTDQLSADQFTFGGDGTQTPQLSGGFLAPTDPVTGPDGGLSGGLPFGNTAGQAGTSPAVSSAAPAGFPGSSPGGTSPGGGNGGGGGAGAGAGGGGELPINLKTLGPGTTQPITDWIKTIMGGFGTETDKVLKAGETLGAVTLGGVSNWFLRGFLIFFAVALIGIGLIVLMWDHGGEQVATKAMKVVKL